jgi:ribonuclease BN (tRNA processing enzyme)
MTTFSVRFLSTASVDSSPMVLLVNGDATTYLVNCGEGCQRQVLEHRQRLAGIKAVCCTRLLDGAGTIGGLPGLLLTASDAGGGSGGGSGSSQTKSNRGNNGNGNNGNGNYYESENGQKKPGMNRKQREAGRKQEKKKRQKQSQQQSVLHLVGPTGLREYVKALRHFMKVRYAASDDGDEDEDAVDDAAMRQRRRTGPSHAPSSSSSSSSSPSFITSFPTLDVRVVEGDRAILHREERDRFSIQSYRLEDGQREPEDHLVSRSGDNDATRPSHTCPPHKKPCWHGAPEGTAAAAAVEATTTECHNGCTDSDRVIEGGPVEQTSQAPRPDEEMSYLFTTGPVLGKFMPAEALRLGVPKGPLFGQLKSGQSVTFEVPGEKTGDNEEYTKTFRTVHPSQVVSPSSPGVGVLVLAYGTRERVRQMTRTHDFQGLLSSIRPPPGNDDEVLDPEQNEVLLLPPPPPPRSPRRDWQLELVVHMTPSRELLEQVIHWFDSQASSSDGTKMVEHVWLPTDHLDASSSDDSSNQRGDRAAPGQEYGTPFRSAALGAATRHALCPRVFRVPLDPFMSYSSALTSSSDPAATDARGFCAEGGEPLCPCGGGRRYAVARTMAEFVLLPRSKRGWKDAASPSPVVHECPIRRSASSWLHRQARENVALQAKQTTSSPDSSSPGAAFGTASALQMAEQVMQVNPLAAAAVAEDSVAAVGGELFFTGTGSAMPCKHRNVSGMCLTAFNGNRMLLDVGEGTIGQLLRRALAEEEEGSRNAATTVLQRFLESIRAVWISHPHADHHLGLLRLIQKRRRRRPPSPPQPLPGECDMDHPEDLSPLLLVAPACIFQFLERCRALGILGRSDPCIDYVPVDCRDLVASSYEFGGAPRDTARRHLEEAFGWKDVWSVPVDHCADAYAVVLDGTPFGRFVYSGDCRPSTRLAQIARPADLLVHEATFEDERGDEARQKMHSTVSEALGVARAMEASCVVLTHFSQRYPRIPPLSLERDAAVVSAAEGPQQSSLSDLRGAATTPIVVFAFDYMRLEPNSLVAASSLTDALRLLHPGGSGGAAESSAPASRDDEEDDMDDDE